MLIALFAAAATAAAAPPVADHIPLDPANTLVVETGRGRFVVEMRPDLAPGHVARVKALARQGYYDNSRFYRVIKGFMAQTGDDGRKQFRSSLPNLKAEFSFATTPALPFAPVGDPAASWGFVGATPVKLDASTGRGHVLFCPGVAAFAHGAGADSANSQIFFMRGRGGPTIEGHFTAWGRIVLGQAVVDSLQDGVPPPRPDRIVRMRVLADIPPVERPRLQVIDTRGPAFKAVLDPVLADRREVFHPCDVTLPEAREG